MRLVYILLISILLVSTVWAQAPRKPATCYSSTDADYFIPKGRSYSEFEITEDLFTWHFGFTVCGFEWGGECQKTLDSVSATIDKASCKIISLECSIEYQGTIDRCDESYVLPEQE